MDKIVSKAIGSVRRNETSFCKFISPNDAGDTGGHQDGFYIPRNSISLLFDVPGIKGENKEKLVTIQWFDSVQSQSRFIYYGRGSRNEYRITRLGRDFQVGDLFVLVKISEQIYEAYLFSNSGDIANFLSAFGIDSSQTNNLIPKIRIHESNEIDFLPVDFDKEEEENEEESDDLTFNPKDIDIVVEQRSLDSLIKRLKYGNINLNTEFQRKGNLWSAATMSKLIESILIRFPLPSFYFDASEDENWLIVDGLQRLHTIKRFVLDQKPLKLTGLEFLKDYNGFTFEMLPGSMKRRIEEAQVTTYLIKPGTPTQVKYSVFHRINTGGLILKAQEIRHALNQGKATIFLIEVTEDGLFKETVRISDRRMQDRELVLRYVAFSLHHYSEYNPSMLHFLNSVMEELNQLPKQRLLILKNGLLNALKVSFELFDNHIFSKSILDDSKPTINRSLFETWTVLLAPLSPDKLKSIASRKAEILKDYRELLQLPKFYKSITESTTTRMQVQVRFSAIEALINKYL